jgi:phenylalanyl-tRNA synthetase beta chain
MNVSYEWLRAFVPFDQSASELRDVITARAATVDELVSLRADLAPIVIARVIEEAPHPDSDHLHVTKVDVGGPELLDVVCGAPNVTAGKLYPFAPTGTVVAGGKKIERRKIRGALSNGMLCSVSELGLGSESDGIMELTIDVPPGTPFLQAVPVGDSRLVIDVSANRPDLLSHLGVAREIAAATGKPLALPPIGEASIENPAAVAHDTAGRAGGVDVRVAEPGLVNRFMGVAIRGVKVAPSPEWLVRRLESVGARSINNVVDASNYVLHELGQPTHAFDVAKLGGTAIVVRRARSGERIITLDGVDRTLDSETIVIADATRPQAIAGIMGGRDSEVTDDTTDIFLEVANFDRRRIRTARRALGMSTDASYRFERGVDLEIAPIALARVAHIIVMLAGGRIEGLPVDLACAATRQPTIALRPRRVATLLGDQVPREAIAALLASVGFSVAESAGSEAMDVTVPSWRGDVSAEVDLIEEVARLRGYDTFPDEIRAFRPGTVPDDSRWMVAKQLRETLVGAGLLEARPLPFVPGGDGFVRLVNPLSENEAYLRRDVLDTLARRAEYNLARMQGDIRLFEIGSIFEPRIGTLPHEELHVGALVMGRREPPHFTDPKSDAFQTWATFNEWDAKALAHRIAEVAYPGRRISLEPAPQAEGTLWNIVVDGTTLGAVKRLSLDAPIWAAPSFGVELSLGVIESADVAEPGKSVRQRVQGTGSVTVSPSIGGMGITRYRPLPTTPPAEFDLALLVPESIRSDAVESAIRRASGELLERLELFDQYTGSGVEPGYRSLAWRLTFRHAERTLRDKEIEGRRAKILGALASELNVRPRTN